MAIVAKTVGSKVARFAEVYASPQSCGASRDRLPYESSEQFWAIRGLRTLNTASFAMGILSLLGDQNPKKAGLQSELKILPFFVTSMKVYRVLEDMSASLLRNNK